MSAKLRVMALRVTWAVLGIAAMVGLVDDARADDASSAPCPSTLAATPEPLDPESEQRAFDREVERYLRHRAFTERLVAERAAREFKADEARYERFRELTNRLTLEAERAAEREFERAVELHAAKIRLTRELSERQASAPIW